jgi:NAD(P)-dependent dehydrogenase (short-subunit alcohol dehydrogenase family)
MAERAALIPAKRMATPDEIAGSIFWLGSEDNGFTTAQVIAASGGE